jgi:ornithine cyclodeaminase/alanine dehydrogenase-like protein (mu-crystallin family)
MIPTISATDLRGLVSMPAAIEALRQAFAVGPTHVPRSHLRLDSSEFLAMPAATGRVFGTKMVTICPNNPERGLPIIQAVYLLFDARDGQPKAILDGTALTSLRTPAVSAFATDVLSRPDARTHGIFGTGPQARIHPAAIRCVRPEATEILVAGRTAGRVADIVDQLQGEGFLSRSATYSEAAGCDIVSTCTRSAEPLFGHPSVRDGSHINLVGSYRPDLREVDASVITTARVFVDELAAAQIEAGELIAAEREGVWGWSQVAGDLCALSSGRARRTNPAERTVFKSVGLAVQDLVVAELACIQAGLLDPTN